MLSCVLLQDLSLSVAVLQLMNTLRKLFLEANK